MSSSAPAPTNLKAASISAHQISLSWNEAAANSSITFRIERRTATSDWSLVASVRDRTSFIDSGLTPATTYYYRVKAVNSSSESGYSNEAYATTATTAISGTDMPLTGLQLWLAADAGLSVSSGGTIYAWPDQSGSFNDATQVTVSSRPVWVDNQVNSRPIVRFDGSGRYFSLLDRVAGGLSGAEAFVVLKANAPGGLWRIGHSGSGSLAYPDANGNIIDDFGSATTTPYNAGAPAQPLNQFHVYNVAGQQGGTWRAAVNNVLLTIASGNSYGAWSGAYLGQASTPFAGDIAEVLIYNRMLTSDERDSVHAYLETKYGIVSTAPSQPVNLAANTISSGQIGLTWQSALGNVSTLFLIERKTGSGGTYAQIAKVRDSTSFIDSGLPANTTYFYQVRSVNPTGASAYSTESSATTTASGPSDIPLAALKTWLKADTGLVGSGGTAPVSTWLDQSGNYNHATQFTSSSRPAWVDNQANGRAVVRFDGSSQYFGLPVNLLQGLAGAEAFAVLKAVQSVPDDPHFLWHLGYSGQGGLSYPDTDGDLVDDFASNANQRIGKPAQALDQLHVYNVAGQSASWMAAINGVVLRNTNVNTYTFAPSPTLGGSATFFAGDIGEIMVFNRVLTPAERDTVNKYLGLKYVLSSTAPLAPTHLIAQQVSSSQIGLTWSAALGNISTVFHIERKTGTDQYAEIAVVRDATSFLDSGLTAATTYDYRIKAVNFVGESAYSYLDPTPALNNNPVTAPGGANMPVANLKLWLKADTGLVGGNGTPVSCWADQSGNHNDAAQANPDVRPILVPQTLYWQPVVRFDGQSQYLNLPANLLNGLSGAEAFVVVKASSTAPSTSKRLWRIGGSGSGSLGYPNPSGQIVDDFASASPHTYDIPSLPSLPPIDQFRLYNVSGQDGGNWLASINGVSPTTQAGNSYGAWPNPTLSSSLAGSAFDGDIAEILIYNQVLSSAERTVVQNYLMNKYRLQDSDGDGIIDGWELQYFGNLTTANGTSDSDQDGILDIDECRRGLDPTHWDGVQGINTVNSLIHDGDADHHLYIRFNANKPSTVTINFYKFAYQYDSGTKDFAGYGRTFLYQMPAVNVPAGQSTLSWDGLISGQFHHANVVTYDVTTSDGSHSETWSPMPTFQPIHAKGVTAGDFHTPGTSTYTINSEYTNNPGTLTISLNTPQNIIVNNQYHQSLVADTAIGGNLDLTHWFGLADNGDYASEVSGSTYLPQAIRTRRTPVYAAFFVDFDPKIDSFSVEAYRVTAAQGEVVHARFILNKPGNVTLQIRDPSGGIHPLYCRDSTGTYVLAQDLPLNPGIQDLEFYPMNQDTSAFKLFGNASSTPKSIPYKGFYRVKYTVTNPSNGKSQFCWASLKIY